MKPNSCLFRAVKRVVENQFGVTGLTSDVFDKYNDGDGVPLRIVVSVINEALSDYGIEVNAIYGRVSESVRLDRPDLLREPCRVPTPVIAYFDRHAEGVIGNESMDAELAYTLGAVAR